MILIKNTRLVDPASATDRICSIVVENDLIREILDDCSGLDQKDFDEVIDGENLVTAPGLIDIHVHFRDPGFTYKEDLVSGADAAARGGFTSVICMANTNPVIDDVDKFMDVKKRAEKACINIFQSAAITKEFKSTELVDFKALLDAGVPGFTNDGIPIMNTSILLKAMREAVKHDVVLAFHEEDNNLISNPGINAGEVSEKMGLGGAPHIAEDVMVQRDCLLAEYTGAKIDIQHISSGRAVDIVRQAQKRGVKVYAEASPHHFTLTQEAVLKHGTYAKMNPPLRTEWDRQEIIKGIKDGTISIIATDHAPHAVEEKKKEFTKAPSGIIGLETSLALGITELVNKGHITVSQLIEKMSFNPSEMYKLGRGRIEAGRKADIVIFDMNEKWIPEKYASKGENTPFTGVELCGKVKYTICDGKIVYDDAKSEI